MAWTLVWGRMAIIYSLVTSSDAESIADHTRWVVRIGMTVFGCGCQGTGAPAPRARNADQTAKNQYKGSCAAAVAHEFPRDRPTTEDQSGWTSISVRPCIVRVAPGMSSGVNSTL
jgi:hypothetical protein